LTVQAMRWRLRYRVHALIRPVRLTELMRSGLAPGHNTRRSGSPGWRLRWRWCIARNAGMRACCCRA
jgi:hypothetical protein